MEERKGRLTARHNGSLSEAQLQKILDRLHASNASYSVLVEYAQLDPQSLENLQATVRGQGGEFKSETRGVYQKILIRYRPGSSPASSAVRSEPAPDIWGLESEGRSGPTIDIKGTIFK